MTKQEALTLALFLGLIAPDNAGVQKAADIADMLSVDMDEQDIEFARAAALANADQVWAEERG